MRRKFIALLMVLVLLICLAAPAFACTPRLNPPKIPTVPDISGSVEVDLPDSVWDNWFKEHPIKLPENFKLPAAVWKGE